MNAGLANLIEKTQQRQENPITSRAYKPKAIEMPAREETPPIIGELVPRVVPDVKPKMDRTETHFPLVRGFAGFDAQASYLIKGYLPMQCAASIYGPSGSFKSFLAISWACHIATGREWNGCKVEQGAVLYIVGEGGVGVSRRIRAWADEYNGGDMPNLYRIDMPVFIVDPLQVAELEIAAAQVKRETGLDVKLIVVDTVARCFGGGDENKASDMGSFIAGCDLVKAHTGATILMVHHSGKNEENGARGSSALRAALDAEYLVKREGGDAPALTLECKKMKDDRELAKQAFDLRSRFIMHDADGDEVTSLVVYDHGREPAEPEELDNVGNLTSNHVAMYQAIRGICEARGGKAPWTAVIHQMKEADTWDGGRGTRWREKLVKERLVIWDATSSTLTLPEKVGG